MRFPFLKSKKKSDGWVAVSFQPEGLTFAHIRHVPNAKPEVTLCGTVHATRADASILAKLGKDLHFDRYDGTTLLAFNEYQLLLVDAPNAPPDELKSAIRWRIKDMLDYHVDDATVDVLDVPPDKNSPTRSHSMYAVTARSELVKNRQQLFTQAKVPLSVIDVPEMAQRNIAALLEPPGRGLAMLTFNDEGGLLTITQGGELYLARRIEVSLAQMTSAGDEQKANLFERIVLELQRSLDHFDRQFNYVALAKLVLGPLPEQLGLKENLASNLSVPVEIMNLDDVLNLSKVPELKDIARQAACFLTLGAALREEEKVL